MFSLGIIFPSRSSRSRTPCKKSTSPPPSPKSPTASATSDETDPDGGNGTRYPGVLYIPPANRYAKKIVLEDKSRSKSGSSPKSRKGSTRSSAASSFSFTAEMEKPKKKIGEFCDVEVKSFPGFIVQAHGKAMPEGVLCGQHNIRKLGRLREGNTGRKLAAREVCVRGLGVYVGWVRPLAFLWSKIYLCEMCCPDDVNEVAFFTRCGVLMNHIITAEFPSLRIRERPY